MDDYSDFRDSYKPSPPEPSRNQQERRGQVLGNPPPNSLQNRTAYTSATTGSQRVIEGFAMIILVGTLLLKLPFATHESISWIDALFTSTSAVTVTGLTVTSTAQTFTIFGQVIILLLLQVGGIGFIAFSVILFRIAGRAVGLRERFMLQQALGVDKASNIFRLTMYVLGMVVGIELLGALLLWVRWLGKLPPGEAAYLAVFHSISAFCNAGFDLFAGTDYPTLFGYGRDPWTLGVLSALIIIGGLGIIVVDDLLTWPDTRLSVHTRLTLTMAAFLTIFGTIVLLIDENLAGELLTVLPADDQFYVGLFTIISARTAGITIIPLEQLSEASKIIVMVWMFIGGAPSSMAGGVSTSTIAVLAVAMLATVRGEQQAIVFNRAIPIETVMKALAVMTVSTLLVAVATLLLSLMHLRDDIFVVAFEVISAFSNTGYSLGLTGELTPLARLVIAFVMFWGRLGPLTLVVVLAQRQHPSAVTYPDEKLILG